MKDKNKSIRFNQEHLKYALKKTGLVKEQALVDYLLSEFYAIGNPKENPFSSTPTINYHNERDNPLINAARGRDANGINNDEIKFPKKVVVTGSPDTHDNPFWKPIVADYKKHKDNPVKIRYVPPVPVSDTIPPMPKREHYEHSVDYGSAKSEWKLKYKQ